MRINKYRYKPSPKFFGEPTNEVYFGLELECYPPRGVDREEFINRHEFFGACPELVYVKEDGSLQYDGIEIVTHPMSLEFLQANRELFSSSLKGLEVQEECGMHIHVSRSAFSDKFHLYRVMRFVSLCAGNEAGVAFMKQVAGREFNTFCTPMPADSILAKLARMESEAAGVHSQDFGVGDPCHYDAINIQNEHTVEFRMFAGTVSSDTITHNVLWVKALIEFMRPRKGDLSSVYEEIIKFKNFLAKTAEFTQLLKLITDSARVVVQPEQSEPEPEPVVSVRVVRILGSPGNPLGIYRRSDGMYLRLGFFTVQGNPCDEGFFERDGWDRFCSIEQLIAMEQGPACVFEEIPLDIGRPVIEVVERSDEEDSITLTAAIMADGICIADSRGQMVCYQGNIPTGFFLEEDWVPSEDMSVEVALARMGWSHYVNARVLAALVEDAQQSERSVDRTFSVEP